MSVQKNQSESQVWGSDPYGVWHRLKSGSKVNTAKTYCDMKQTALTMFSGTGKPPRYADEICTVCKAGDNQKERIRALTTIRDGYQRDNLTLPANFARLIAKEVKDDKPMTLGRATKPRFRITLPYMMERLDTNNNSIGTESGHITMTVSGDNADDARLKLESKFRELVR